ncbi:hypothetical protein [Bernardetia sp.]|uniref:hypothetical protein n=1 Tax=Bernardetia sp. TaxID=1937974 RepID=UPI0025B892F6|nr:hypothetical protein [Bernardetia sp.]
MNHFFSTTSSFLLPKLCFTLILSLFSSMFSLVLGQVSTVNKLDENEISVMEFTFEKDKSPTLQGDTFPQFALEILSKYETKSSYELKYDVEIAHDSEKEGNYNIAFFSKEVVGGTYRNLSIADYLLPEQISFNIIWGHENQKEDDSTIKKEFSNVEFDVNHKLNVEVAFTKSDDIRPILIENIVFHYGDLQEKALRSRVTLIDEYYKESQKIKEFLQDLEAIRNKKIQDDTEVKQKLEYIQKAIKKLDAYSNELITEGQDPAELRKQLSKLKTTYTQTHSTVFTKTTESEKFCQDEYQKGKKFLEEAKANSAQMAFSSVLQKCPTHAPSLIRRAQLFYQEGDFENARQDLSHLPKGEKLNTVLENENDLRASIESVYYDLFAFFVRKGDYAAKNLEFDEAFHFFSQAKEICLENPFLPNCDDQLAPRLAKAQKDQLEYLDAQITSSLYENNLSEAVDFVTKSKSILNTKDKDSREKLSRHEAILTQKLAKRTKDAIVIQNWEEALNSLELNIGLAEGLTKADSTSFWKHLGKKLQIQTEKELLLYSAVRYSQLDLPLTNSLLKRLTEVEISKNEWQQLGQDIGKKDYYLQPEASPEEVITRYVLLDPALNKNFQKGYFEVWKKLDKE